MAVNNLSLTLILFLQTVGVVFLEYITHIKSDFSAMLYGKEQF